MNKLHIIQRKDGSLSVKQAKPVQLVASVRPCSSCRWRVKYGNGLNRCHARPPQVKFPYDNMSVWPVVPEAGGGCALHEEAR